MDEHASKSNHNFWLDFIKTYKNEPALWKLGSKEYLNREKKRQAYQKLLYKFKELYPFSTLDAVKKKINNFRSTFRKELKKVNASLANGEIYEPALYYYKNLLFLTDQENSETGSTLFMDSEEEFDAKYNCSVSMSPPEHIIEDSPTVETISPAISSHYQSFHPKRRKRTSTTEVYKLNEELPTEDYFDLIGRTWASKLRRLPEHVQLMAEKAVSDTLFDYEIKTQGDSSNNNLSQLPLVKHQPNFRCCCNSFSYHQIRQTYNKNCFCANQLKSNFYNCTENLSIQRPFSR